MARIAFIERLLIAAQTHGEASEPDHEVGDLQAIVRVMHTMLTPTQKAAFKRLGWEDHLSWLPEEIANGG